MPIRLGLSVEQLIQRHGIVSVKFSDGTHGEYDLVVAADGIDSAVRRLTFGPTAVPRPWARPAGDLSRPGAPRSRPGR